MIKVVIIILLIIHCNHNKIILYNSIPEHNDSKLRVRGEDCSYSINMFPVNMILHRENSLELAFIDMKKNSLMKTDSFKNVEFNYTRKMNFLLLLSDCFVIYGTPVIKLEDKAGSSK